MNPNELPAIDAWFRGREAELHTLEAALRSGRSICVTGPSGIGKTSLARAAGRRMQEGAALPVIWAGAGMEPISGRVMGLDSLLGILLRALTGNAAAGLDIPRKMARLNEALAAKPSLIVIDELESVAEAGEIMELVSRLPKGSLALITSEVALGGIEELRLGPIPPDEAAGLYRAISGHECEDGVCCIGVPLGVELAAAGGFLMSGEAWLQSAFDALDEEDRLLLARLTVLMVPATPEDIYRMFGEAVQAGLDRLVARHMLGLEGGLYTMHPEMRRFAAGLLSAEDAVRSHKLAYEGFMASDPIVAAENLYEYAMRDEAMLKEFAGFVRKLISVLEMEGSRDMALRKCRQGIEVSRRLALKNSEADFLNQYALITARMGDAKGALEAFNNAISVAREAANPQIEAVVLGNMAGLHQGLGELDAALECAMRSIELARSAGDAGGSAETLMTAASIRMARGETDEALTCLNEALEGFRGIGNRQGEAGALVNISTIRGRAGETDEALRGFISALDAFAAAGDRAGAAYALFNIGGLFAELGNMDEAILRLRQSLGFYEALGATAEAERARRLIARVEASR